MPGRPERLDTGRHKQHEGGARDNRQGGFPRQPERGGSGKPSGEEKAVTQKQPALSREDNSV